MTLKFLSLAEETGAGQLQVNALQAGVNTSGQLAYL